MCEYVLYYKHMQQLGHTLVGIVQNRIPHVHSIQHDNIIKETT